MKKGITDIKNVMKGGTPITKVIKGTNLIWEVWYKIALRIHKTYVNSKGGTLFNETKLENNLINIGENDFNNIYTMLLPNGGEKPQKSYDIKNINDFDYTGSDVPLKTLDEVNGISYLINSPTTVFNSNISFVGDFSIVLDVVFNTLGDNNRIVSSATTPYNTLGFRVSSSGILGIWNGTTWRNNSDGERVVSGQRHILKIVKDTNTVTMYVDDIIGISIPTTSPLEKLRLGGRYSGEGTGLYGTYANMNVYSFKVYDYAITV